MKRKKDNFFSHSGAGIQTPDFLKFPPAISMVMRSNPGEEVKISWLTFVLQAVVFWKTTQVDIISQCTTQAGPIPCGKMAANRLKAITLAVIELKCHKNWKRPPFQCKFFFSGNVYLKLLWYTTKDQATEHKLDTIEITRIHFLMGKFVSKSVSKCVEFTTSGSLIRM